MENKTVFIHNRTQAAVSFPYGNSARSAIVVYAHDVRELKVETWQKLFKTCPQVGDMVEAGNLEVLTMPADADKIKTILAKLGKMGAANTDELFAMSAEENAVALQHRTKMALEKVASPHMVAMNNAVL